MKIGGKPVAFQFGYRYYADGPNGGPVWGLRFTITLLFPKNKLIEATKEITVRAVFQPGALVCFVIRTTQNTSACKPATFRTVCAIRERDFSGRWLQPILAIGRVAE